MSEPCPSRERWQEHLDGTCRPTKRPCSPSTWMAVPTAAKPSKRWGRKRFAAGCGPKGGRGDRRVHARLHEVLAQFRLRRRKRGRSLRARATIALSFLTASEKPGCLGRLGHYEVQEVIGKGGFGNRPEGV